MRSPTSTGLGDSKRWSSASSKSSRYLKRYTCMRALRGLVGWGITSITTDGRAPLNLRSKASSDADLRHWPGGFGRWAFSIAAGVGVWVHGSSVAGTAFHPFPKNLELFGAP